MVFWRATEPEGPRRAKQKSGSLGGAATPLVYWALPSAEAPSARE